jgi:hypothetical protein
MIGELEPVEVGPRNLGEPRLQARPHLDDVRSEKALQVRGHDLHGRVVPGHNVINVRDSTFVRGKENMCENRLTCFFFG